MKTPNSALSPGQRSKKNAGTSKQNAGTGILTSDKRFSASATLTSMLSVNTNLDPDQLIAKHAKHFLTKRQEKEFQVASNTAEKLKAFIAAECNFVEKKEYLLKDLEAAVRLKASGFSMDKIMTKYPEISERTLYRAVKRSKNKESLVKRVGRPQAQLSHTCMAAIEEQRAEHESNSTGFVLKSFVNVVKANFPAGKKQICKNTMKRLMKKIIPAPTKSSHNSTAAREKAKKNLLNYISWAVSLTAMTRKFKKQSEERLRKLGKPLDENAPFMCMEMVSNIDSTSCETWGGHTNKEPEIVWTSEEQKIKARQSGQAISKAGPIMQSNNGNNIFISLVLSYLCNVTLLFTPA
jgi:hypothetical protein